FADQLRRLVDTVRLSWLKWVIEYDFGRQMGLLRTIGDALGIRDGQVTSAEVGRWLKTRRTGIGAIALCLVGAAVAVGVLRRRMRNDGRRGSRGADGREHPVVQLYARAARTLARRGFPRAPSTTPREHAGNLVAGGAPGAGAFATLTELYYLARYAGE